MLWQKWLLKKRIVTDVSDHFVSCPDGLAPRLIKTGQHVPCGPPWHLCIRLLPHFWGVHEFSSSERFSLPRFHSTPMIWSQSVNGTSLIGPVYSTKASWKAKLPLVGGWVPLVGWEQLSHQSSRLSWTMTRAPSWFWFWIWRYTQPCSAFLVIIILAKNQEAAVARSFTPKWKFLWVEKASGIGRLTSLLFYVLSTSPVQLLPKGQVSPCHWVTDDSSIT